MNPQEHVDLPGSARPPVSDATLVGEADPEQRVRLTLTLAGPALPDADSLPSPGLTTEEFARRYGARAADAEQVATTLRGYGLTVDDTSLPTRSMHVSGTVAQIEAAFRTTLSIYRPATGGEFRAREGSLQVPAALGGIVTGVFGIDERRVAHRRSVAPAAPATTVAPYTPGDLEQLYAFPAGSGAGQQVAIAEFGGAWIPEDVSAFCDKYGIPDPVGNVSPISVGIPVLTLADIEAMPPEEREIQLIETSEVMMDVEIVAALCPASDVSVFFAPFSEQGWIDLLNAVATRRPVALSVSWGAAETAQDWSSGALDAINDRLAALATLGVTVCVAAGDDGSGDGLADGTAHVDFPGSSPYVLGIGGTMIDDNGDEVTWWEAPGQRTQNGGGATGGGVSEVWEKPQWQDAIDIPTLNGDGTGTGRIVPDVAALAGDPLYDLVFLGQDAPNGGTSASAPLWAALIARVAASLPSGWSQQFLTPLLYANDPAGSPNGASVCRDITIGHNTSNPDPGYGYFAGTGFDAATGWGVPDGAALRTLLLP